MPEITCPNCGLTINLENRRKIDYGIIMDATRNSATFTGLLHATKLSRKTLSMRLKELCVKGTIVKSDGIYKLDTREEANMPRTIDRSIGPLRGAHFMNSDVGSAQSLQVENHGRNFSRAFRDRRVRNAVWMLMLLTSFSLSGYVLAMHFASPEQVHSGPVIIGYSTMAVEIRNVNDLYGWQVAVSFNATELKVLQVTPGNFVGLGYPFFWDSTDTGEGLLLVGGTLEGDSAGKNGNGTLTTIVFGYFTSNYKAPLIVPQQMGFETSLIDSQLADIPIGTKLSLEVLS
jgi:hypothetical protein